MPANATSQTLDAKSRLLKEIATSIRDGSLELPSLPDIAIEVRVAISKADLDINKLARLIQQDPGLAAYLMKVSHSAVYNRGNPVTSLTMAVSRLGLNTTRDLTMSYALRALFLINDTGVKRMLRQYWQRSVHTAALAHTMAKRYGFNPDRAMLAGLLQDIGALPILAKLKSYPELLNAPADTERLLREYTGKINGLILHAWQFDTEMKIAALNRENWMRDSDNPADLTDLILIARYHTYLHSGSHKTLPKLWDLPAFKRLGLEDVDPAEGIAFLKEAEQEIEDLRCTLQGG